MSKPQEHASTAASRQLESNVPAEFLQRHLRELFSLVFCLLSNRAEAQEITQEAFIAVLQRYRSIRNNNWIIVAIREAAISSAIRSVRRNAIHAAEDAGRPRGLHSHSPELLAPSRWGERVVVLLRDTQSLAIEKIAVLLECSVQTVRNVLAQARARATPAGVPVPGTPGSSKLCASVLAQAAVSENLSELPFRLRRHARRCARCQSAASSLSAAAAINRQSALDELRTAEAVVDWPSLEREMMGNIAVGIAAARCIQHVHKKRRFAWRMVFLCAAASGLFVVGWLTHIPIENTRRLLQSLSGAFAGQAQAGVALARVEAGSMVTLSPAGGVLAISHPPSASVRVLQSSHIAALFAEPATADIRWIAIPTSAGALDRSAATSRPAFHLNFAPGSPIALQDFSVVPLPRRARDTSDRHPFRLTLRVTNVSAKPVAAVVFEIKMRTRAGLAKAYLGSEALNANPGNAFSLSGEFDPATNGIGDELGLALDSVLFSDLTTYGADRAEALRSLTADEVASEGEREYVKRLLSESQTAALRRELNFGLSELPARANFEILDRAQPSAVHGAVIESTGVPVELQTLGAASGALDVHLSNRSARAIDWFQIAILSLDAQGRLLTSEDVQQFAHLSPGAITSLRLQDRIRLRSTEGVGPLARKLLYLRAVRFSNGEWWTADPHTFVGPWAASAASDLLSAIPERLRLAALFRLQGLGAVEQELGYASNRAFADREDR